LSEQIIKQKAKAVALRAIRLVTHLPLDLATDEIGRQFLRCAAALGVFWCHGASSSQDHLQRYRDMLCVAEECLYWLELLEGSHILQQDKTSVMVDALMEIMALCISKIQTLDPIYRVVTSPPVNSSTNPDTNSVL
jgi:four helix bundle protein